MSLVGFSVREVVGEALRFSRATWRFNTRAAALGAGVITALTIGVLSARSLSMPLNAAMALAQACVYAVFVAAALYGPRMRERWFLDGVRVWAAMAMVALFLFLVLLTITVPATIVLFSGPLAPFLPDLERAGTDQAQVMAVMTRFAEANPGLLLSLAVACAVIMLLLSSRLYLAAPASVDQGRVLTFATWSWTKGQMWRIAGARLLLLAPANILAGAIGYLFGRMIGVDAMAPAGQQFAIPAFSAYVLVAGFVSLALYSSLEAGLSAALYRRLKPQR